MQLTGLHHVTMITGDAQSTIDFYAGTLGLRLVKQTVNFDAPEAYHLYFGDEHGSPGSILTWFEFAGAAPGRPGAGMIHTLELGVRTATGLDFWAARLAENGHPVERVDERLRFSDPDGLSLELMPRPGTDPPLCAETPGVPTEHAITGVVGARAYAADPGRTEPLLRDTLGFEHHEAGRYGLTGSQRTFRYTLQAPPTLPGRQGAGTVHHIAWGSADEDQLAWQQRIADAGALVTEIRDRDYFRSIYFREPQGVLFELATLSPGFAVDEDPDHLGESLRLPRMHEHLRGRLQQTLTPIVNPRTR